MTDDDDVTPKLGRPGKRFQSQTDRDLDGLAAKRDRNERSAPVPQGFEDDSGNYTGDDLAAIRARRPTPQRIGHLEERVDGVVNAFGEFRAEHARDLGEVTSAVGTLTGEVRGLKTVIEASTRREHYTFKSQVEVDTAQKLEVVTAKGDRRKLILQVVKIVGGAIALAATFSAGRC